jgi:hypothetical protein
MRNNYREVKEGPTPAGGVKAEIYYFDNNNKSVDKAGASRAIIRELDANGNLISETTANINH